MPAQDLSFRPSSPPFLGHVEPPPADSHSIAADLLQENHTRWHMHFREIGGHNHTAHSVLTTLALGGSPADLRRAYADDASHQRPIPAVDWALVRAMEAGEDAFLASMYRLDLYPTFLAFFEREIARQGGDWRAVVAKYCFSGTELAEVMLAQLFEGLYHPFIHLALGVEFEIAGVVAEGLAQAASHTSIRLADLYERAGRLATAERAEGRRRTPLVELYRAVRADPALRTAIKRSDGPRRLGDGVLGRALEAMAQAAAQFRVEPTEDDVERATAEMISCAAWACGAAESGGTDRGRKMDFFGMHGVTSSLSVTAMVRQPWISIADKARLVERKTWLDLTCFVASGSPELREQNLSGYEPTLSKSITDWGELYAAVRGQHDDGHAVKLIRALKNGEDATARFDQEPGVADFLPVRGDSWFRLAQLCYDTTTTGRVNPEEKFVWGIGFEQSWQGVPV